MREYIDCARQQQLSEPAPAERTGKHFSDVGLRTDLELCKQDNRALRAETSRLKGLLRQRLGHDLEAEAAHTLKLRIDDLTEANRRYSTEAAHLRDELQTTKARAQELESDLVAARTRLRRLMRTQNRHDTD